ncbi:glucosamine-6-phosphate deaminase [Neobacillus massiliamazoniensis]|uniref:Glucosamine-6-phosphate deaminase n=1 Tax=Neobacillus massiliamazoniensis TaxID=1499688 RepID=A0A0U1NUL9_9BACI|nr:glucosamine-6-phosphate deaminase [Neobacillus massiliamazoniensis]CRK81452.1 glucosamine-6-phosphate deaminase [Neobacillus massiliamazoniensis]
MKIIRVSNYEDMSKQAGKLMVEKIRSNPSMVLGLATGSTPIGVYQYLIKDHKDNSTSYKNIKTINLDEYIGLPFGDSNSYHDFMKNNLFNHLDIQHENTYIPNGNAKDLDIECARYETLIQEIGGIDLQILGIGENGHIGFNEPGTAFDSRTHIVNLAENTRVANSRFFQSIADVPTHAITMGIASILDSREIFLLASGVKKAQAIACLMTGKWSEDFPASALMHHKNVTIIADEDALTVFDKEN